MKTIGLIGGMSWESSAVYYELINKMVNEKEGGFSSCKCLMFSVDFAEIEALQHGGDWKKLNEIMADAAIKLQKGGADIIVLCTNTMHLCSDAITAAVSVPFLHIAEAVGASIRSKGLTKVGLLGTKFTMEKEFYKIILKDKYGIETIIPFEPDRATVHRIIYRELVHGELKDESREIFKSITSNLVKEGAQGIILGCTEIPILISNHDFGIPVFDTTRIHAEKAVEWVLT